ncbi:penicillin-binding transpeptidase domain-containing protein [Paenibacillus sp. LHD-38]|uniref:peptidoglycan D,D-transpeptidase FtsI family protein n=1 Tax=Paenibacillus sp. LHD-38 TaxID=3072143 RepID=UPI00280FDD30|nr:penicillin-binding transpeptidase domain-containing protein [Paenibacillus sp. LHD-38]MDQ8733175.1 penicillin-binding transpeptidase domain-containing protein [Paenibacillus sp. LHD-38]
MQDDPQKREIINRRHFSFRLNLFFFITFALFSILIVRLAILQFVEGPTLSAEGINKATRSVKIPPIRGNIYDSTGYPIAYSTSTQSLYFSIQPELKLEDAKENAKEMAAKLVEVFTKFGDPTKAMTVDDIIRQMDLDFRRNTISTPRRIKSGLTNKEIAYFMENRTDFKGVDIMEESVRNYDTNSIAVQLVGYLKKYKGVRETVDFYKEKTTEDDATLQYLEEEDVGMDGLEYMYQDVLRGTNGLKTYPVNNAERIIGPMQITNPQKGSDIYLTINKNVQLKTEQAIMDQLKKITTSSNKYERAEYAKTGFAVAMEVDTGKIVAMASMPDYDSNIWAGGRISSEDYENFSNVLENGTIRSVYGKYDSEEERKKHPSSIVPLGSTMKPLSVLIGLNEKLFTTSSYYLDTGVFTYGRKGYEVFIRNSQRHVYGNIDGAEAIEHSSNPFMAAMVGDRLYNRGTVNGKSSVEIWDDYMKQFGLGVLTESGLMGESKGIIEYFDSAERYSSQAALILASFGQQGRYTTLQLAQYAAMLANHGKRLKPQFVNQIKDSDGNVVQGYTPEILNEVNFPAEYWKEIETGMSMVSSQGFEGVDYTYRRKTGTSEQDVAKRTAENAVFIAYAPADKPKLAVAVVVPDGGFGSYGASPIARQIFDAYNEEIGLYGVPKKKTADAGNAGNTADGNAANNTADTADTNE